MGDLNFQSEVLQLDLTALQASDTSRRPHDRTVLHASPFLGFFPRQQHREPIKAREQVLLPPRSGTCTSPYHSHVVSQYTTAILRELPTEDICACADPDLHQYFHKRYRLRKFKVEASLWMPLNK